MATRFTSIGVKVLATVGGIAIASVAGISSGVINFSAPNGTSTGAVIQVASVARYQEFPTTCVATGGLTKYSMCVARSPYTTTGTLLAAGAECGSSFPKSLPGDFSFKKNIFSSTGSSITNLDGVTLGSGANVLSQLAVGLSWNPADLFTFTSLVTPTGTLGTSRYDCQMWTRVLDKYGS